MFNALENECYGSVETETVTVLHNLQDLLRTKWVLAILEKERVDQEEAQSCLEQLQQRKTSLDHDLLQADNLVSQCEEKVAQEEEVIRKLLLKEEAYKRQLVEKQEEIASFKQQTFKIKELKKGDCLKDEKQLLCDEHNVAAVFVSKLSALLEKIDTYHLKRQALLCNLKKVKLQKEKEKTPLIKRYQDNMIQMI